MSENTLTPAEALIQAKARLDQHTREIVQWHFQRDRQAVHSGWKRRRELNFDPLTEISGFEDLKKFPPSRTSGFAAVLFVDGSRRASRQTDLRL